MKRYEYRGGFGLFTSDKTDIDFVCYHCHPGKQKMGQSGLFLQIKPAAEQKDLGQKRKICD